MTERPIEVSAGGGVLRGHVGGTGIPALLLHGGPGLPDYMEGCAGELSRLFTTIRYTQRGVEPTTVGPPSRSRRTWPTPSRSSTRSASTGPGRSATRGVGTSRSTSHFERGTLRDGLPGVRLPALFVHGIDDPLPLRSSSETARLIPGARVGPVSRAGHFPWLEQPGFLERTIRGLV